MFQADATTFSRSFIPGDREVSPFVLSGPRRLFFLAAYWALVSTSIVGMVYTLYISPAFAATAIVLAYYFDNLAFFCGHMMYHAQFIEAPEQEMGTLCH